MRVMSNSTQTFDDSIIVLDFQSNYESGLSLDTVGFFQHSSRRVTCGSGAGAGVGVNLNYL
jgi:hypothetical protein